MKVLSEEPTLSLLPWQSGISEGGIQGTTRVILRWCQCLSIAIKGNSALDSWLGWFSYASKDRQDKYRPWIITPAYREETASLYCLLHFSMLWLFPLHPLKDRPKSSRSRYDFRGFPQELLSLITQAFGIQEGAKQTTWEELGLEGQTVL